MTHNFGRTIALGLVLFWARPFCVAQGYSWEKLSSVERGSKLTVVLTDGNTTEGRLREWGPAGLTVLQKDRVLSLPRTDVRKVVLVSGRSSFSRAGRLALIGGVVGGGLFAAVCASRSNCGASPAALGAAAAFVAVQAAAGSERFSPQHSEVIYSADHTPHTDAQD